MRDPEDIHDEWLVLRCQDGDAAALAELVERWQPRLWRHAMRLTDDRDAAERRRPAGLGGDHSRPGPTERCRLLSPLGVPDRHVQMCRLGPRAAARAGTNRCTGRRVCSAGNRSRARQRGRRAGRRRRGASQGPETAFARSTDGALDVLPRTRCRWPKSPTPSRCRWGPSSRGSTTPSKSSKQFSKGKCNDRST